MQTMTNDKPMATESPVPEKKRGFLHHAAIYGFGAVSLQLVSIVLMPVYTAHMSTAEYGLLQAIYRVGGVLNICLMINGFHLATFNLWGDDRASRRIHLASSVLLLTLLIVSGGGLLAWLGREQLATWLGVSDARLLSFGVFAMLLNAFILIPLALMQARMESLWYVISTLLITITQLTLVTLSLVVFDAGVWGVLVALAITYGTFGLLLVARELWHASLRPDRGLMMEILRFSLPFVPSGLFFFVLNSGDQFFLLKFHGLAAVGVYTLAYKITTGVVAFATQPFIKVWTAWMYRAYGEPQPDVVFAQVITRIMTALIFAGTALILFQNEILWALSTPAFARAGTVIAILVAAHVFLVFGNLLDCAFYVTKRTYLKPWVAGAAAAVMTIAYAALIPRWEIVGAAWATLIGFVFFAVLNYFVAQRAFRISLEFRRLVMVLVISGAIAAVGYPLGIGWLQSATKLALLSLLPILLWATSVVSQDEKAYARGALLKAGQWIGGTSS